MVVIAFLINNRFHFAKRSAAPVPSPLMQPSTISPTAVYSPIENAEFKRAELKKKYLYGSLPQKTGITEVAVAVATETGGLNRSIGDALSQRFKSATVQVQSAVFKPEFFSDRFFNYSYDKFSELCNQLELAKSLDALVLARQNVDYVKNPQLENVITATMRLEVAMFPMTNSAQAKTWVFVASGAGFKQDDARLQAEERLIKQIGDDRKMSLAP